jgi:hypothetical protein
VEFIGKVGSLQGVIAKSFKYNNGVRGLGIPWGLKAKLPYLNYEYVMTTAGQAA